MRNPARQNSGCVFQRDTRGHLPRKKSACELCGAPPGRQSRALDLALGLERLYRRPVIDESDFYEARYRGDEANPGELPKVRIEVVLTDLSEEARRRFALGALNSIDLAEATPGVQGDPQP